MATAAAKATNGPATLQDNRYIPLNSISDTLQLSYSVDNRVEPYELVEIFYGSSSVSPATHASQLSPRSAGTSSPEIMQVLEQAPKDKQLPDSYTCEVCGRLFREASHFTKHKRGALCRKLALRMAKKNKKKKGNGSDCAKKNAILQKPYLCNVCGAKFCDKVNVELHIERQHNSKQQLWVEISKSGGFTCAECGRWFQDKGNLVEHQKQHMQTYLHQNERLNHSGERLLVPDRSLVQQPHNVAVAYYHDALHQVQSYGQQPQPSHLPPPPPAPPPVAHVHSNMTTILHTPQMGPTNLAPTAQPVPQSTVPCLSPLPNQVPSMGPVDNMSKTLKNNKSDKLLTNSKWNICGDCGLKFVDPMNLEIHIQRIHPDSYMLETVNLGYGTILYKTNNTRSDVQCLLSQNGTVSSDTKQNKPNPQTFDCILCGFKATSKNYIFNHLQNVHSTSNVNFIHVLETLECGRKGSRGAKGKKGSQDPLLREQRHVCDACKAVFLSKAELIRHRIKDKQYMCGVCCHASCSQLQITAHMATHETLADSTRNTSGSGLICWICGVVLLSASLLDNHMVTHGTMTAECITCGEHSDRLEALVPHLSVHLPHQSSRVRLTFSRADQPSTPYTTETEVCVDGTIGADAGFLSSGPLTAVSSDKEPTRIPEAYACSECGACLSGAAQLEAHLQVHQSPCAASSHGSTANHGTFTTTTATAVSSSQNGGMCASSVDKVPGSFEFRCEECGFWRQESEPVMRHIQAVHMSGNMLQSIKLQSGIVQINPIHVVTPISALSAQ
ncbi:zinc finger protein 420-like [Macrobrachium rosenbergii]|uniref:zinc finger protein 420-like n=1 Tax=Macrobrachium rosenbergii TaxID=79674 RepID=UPI0034D4ED9B